MSQDNKPGVRTTEFWTTVVNKLIGLAIVIMGLWGPADPDTSLYIILIGVGLILADQSVYTIARTLIKSKLGQVAAAVCLIIALSLVTCAPPAMAGALDDVSAPAAQPAAPVAKPVTEVPEPATLAQQVAALKQQVNELARYNDALRAQLGGDRALAEAALRGLQTEAALNMRGINLNQIQTEQTVQRYLGRGYYGPPPGAYPQAQQVAPAAKQADEDSWGTTKTSMAIYGFLTLLHKAGIVTGLF